MEQKYYDEHGNEVVVDAPKRNKRNNGGCLKWAVIIIGALFLLGFCGAMLGDSGDELDTEETTEEVAEQTEEAEEEISEEDSDSTDVDTDTELDEPETNEPTTAEEVEAETEESEQEPEKDSKEVEEEPEEEKKEESSEVKEKPEPISIEDEGLLTPEFALSLMESNFEGMANVTYSSEDKAFLIEPTDQEIKTALILLLEGSTPEINASWELLKDSFVSASDSIKDSVGTGYQIHLLNPMNNENSLLIIIDGVVIYDAFSQ